MVKKISTQIFSHNEHIRHRHVHTCLICCTIRSKNWLVENLELISLEDYKSSINYSNSYLSNNISPASIKYIQILSRQTVSVIKSNYRK